MVGAEADIDAGVGDGPPARGRVPYPDARAGRDRISDQRLFLEIVPLERIVVTDALEPGFRPAALRFFAAVITMEDHDGGTKYTARAMHKDDADRETHEKMGFYEGWGTNIEQLGAVAESLKGGA